MAASLLRPFSQFLLYLSHYPIIKFLTTKTLHSPRWLLFLLYFGFRLPLYYVLGFQVINGMIETDSSRKLLIFWIFLIPFEGKNIRIVMTRLGESGCNFDLGIALNSKEILFLFLGEGVVIDHGHKLVVPSLPQGNFLLPLHRLW